MGQKGNISGIFRNSIRTIIYYHNHWLVGIGLALNFFYIVEKPPLLHTHARTHTHTHAYTLKHTISHTHTVNWNNLITYTLLHLLTIDLSYSRMFVILFPCEDKTLPVQRSAHTWLFESLVFQPEQPIVVIAQTLPQPGITVSSTMTTGSYPQYPQQYPLDYPQAVGYQPNAAVVPMATHDKVPLVVWGLRP